MTLRASNQVLCNVWSYVFYDMTLATSFDKKFYAIGSVQQCTSYPCEDEETDSGEKESTSIHIIKESSRHHCYQ